MAKTVLEYIHYLQEKPGLIWPRPPKPVPLKATPFLKPIPAIKAVAWEIYGTLLTIDLGKLVQLHSQELRMQIALQKTIDEFHMWYSMSRKPGQPWEYMLRQYTTVLEELQMAGAKRKGDYPEVNSARVWNKLLDRLQRNEYAYDEDFFGDLDALAIKVAYFFHASLQGVAAAPAACETLKTLTMMGIRQALVADAQPFTTAQLSETLRSQSHFEGTSEVFASSLSTLSCEEGLRKPSLTFYEHAASRLRNAGIAPDRVLYVTHRLRDDIAGAKKVGFRTALLAADANCCSVTQEDMRDPALKPDRLLTEIAQVLEIIGDGKK